LHKRKKVPGCREEKKRVWARLAVVHGEKEGDQNVLPPIVLGGKKKKGAKGSAPGKREPSVLGMPPNPIEREERKKRGKGAAARVSLLEPKEGNQNA